MKEKYPLSKDFLFRFSEAHPEVLQAYKQSLPDTAQPLTSEQIKNEKSLEPSDVIELGKKLSAINSGREHADDYHNFVLDSLNEIFYPALTRPKKEQPIDDGRKRVDILYTNSAEKGFFSGLVNRHNYLVPYVTVECKNYTEDLNNPEIDQMIGRFSRKRGRFGIIMCRAIQDRNLLLKRLQDIVNNNSENCLIALDDSDLMNLLMLRAEQKEREINEYLEDKLKAVLM